MKKNITVSSSKTVKPKAKVLHVDLGQGYYPHPEILKVFKDNGAMHLYNENVPMYKNEERLFLAAAASKKPIAHKINAVYRRRVNRREYAYFFDACFGKDFFGNPIYFTRLLGKYSIPKISKEF